jgi:hypothetical protein
MPKTLRSGERENMEKKVVIDVLDDILKQNVESVIPIIHKYYKDGIISRELSAIISIVDYTKRKQTDPNAEVRNSEWYIGRSVKDYI